MRMLVVYVWNGAWFRTPGLGWVFVGTEEERGLVGIPVPRCPAGAGPAVEGESQNLKALAGSEDAGENRVQRAFPFGLRRAPSLRRLLYCFVDIRLGGVGECMRFDLHLPTRLVG